MNAYRISSFSQVKPLQALSLLRVLRAKKQGQSVAFFRTSRSEGECFVPTLTILGFNPSTTFQSKNGKILIQNEPGDGGRDTAKTEKSGNPFQVFSELLAEKKSGETLVSLPFFQGGALGYFGYDAVRFVEPRLQKTKNLNPVTETFDAELVFYRHYLVFKHETDETLLISEAETSEEEITASLIALANNLIHSAPTEAAGLREEGEIPLAAFRSSFGKDAFIEGVKKLKSHIKDGDIFQAVLSERFQHEYSGDALDLFEALLQVNPAPYQFFFEIDGRTFLGASPEMLLKADGRKIETHPIAGTRPRGKTPAEERKNEIQLLSSVKENAEHLMLVDLARNDIGRVSKPGSVCVESFQKLRKFGGVMHLVSEVTGQLPANANTLSAFTSCFPAGTLSGAPKIRAMSLLSDLEPESRGFYGGAFIAASITGDIDSCIAIRSLSIENEIVTVQAGAGIVADSSPEKEYQEIEHKSRLARKALAIAVAKGTTKNKLGAAI